MDAGIARAAALIADADALLVTAGAGMGVDSGLPDFRGPEGFWRAYPALRQRGLGFMDVASPFTFESDPALAWGFYGHRLALYRATTPHAGFGILRRWGGRTDFGAAVFTSNVDGHFGRAGFGDGPLVECHGSIHHLQCSAPCSDALWPADGFEPEVDAQACLLRGALPRCPRCGAVARPNILMFGDSAWIDDREAAQRREIDRWLARAERIVVVELGAGTAIPSVRHFGQRALIEREAVLVRINPREPAVPRRQDVALPMPALAALEAIDACLAG